MHPRRPTAPSPARLLPLAALAAVPLLLACEPKSPPPPQPAMTAQSLDDLKAAFKRNDPSVVIGDVTEVLPDDPFLSATFPEGSVAQGDVVTVVDAGTDIVAQGTVARVSPGDVAVRFAEPQPATTRPAGRAATDAPRRPKVGDLVLKYPN